MTIGHAPATSGRGRSSHGLHPGDAQRQTGRTFGCDDVDRLGWDVIEAVLDKDGVCGFRMIPVESAQELASRLGERGFHLDLRDVFTGDRQRALPISEKIVRKGLSDRSGPGAFRPDLNERDGAAQSRSGGERTAGFRGFCLE